MLDPSWNLTKRGTFGWYSSAGGVVPGLWLASMSFADANATLRGSVSAESATLIERQVELHSEHLVALPELRAAVHLGSLMGFALSDDFGGGYLIVLPQGLMSVTPLAQLLDRGAVHGADATSSKTSSVASVGDADVVSNMPAMLQLFSATKDHVLKTVAPGLARELTPIVERARRAWEFLLNDTSRQALECFHSSRPRNALHMVPDLRLLMVTTTVPCSRDALPAVFRDLCPPSKHPYVSFILDIVNQRDSSEFEYLVHAVTTCNPETRRMSLQLGIFPNAVQMRSNAPRLFPIEVLTPEERMELGV